METERKLGLLIDIEGILDKLYLNALRRMLASSCDLDAVQALYDNIPIPKKYMDYYGRFHDAGVDVGISMFPPHTCLWALYRYLHNQ